MMKIKFLLLLLCATLSMSGQEKKLFTLEDLNFGGTNYRNLQPENKWYAWWGDELIRIDNEQCFLVDKKTGKDIRVLTDDENRARNTSYPPMAVARLCTVLLYTEMNLESRRGPSGVLTANVWHSIAWTRAW